MNTPLKAAVFGTLVLAAASTMPGCYETKFHRDREGRIIYIDPYHFSGVTPSRAVDTVLVVPDHHSRTRAVPKHTPHVNAVVPRQAAAAKQHAAQQAAARAAAKQAARKQGHPANPLPTDHLHTK